MFSPRKGVQEPQVSQVYSYSLSVPREPDNLRKPSSEFVVSIKDQD
jgi:hypothetical protein